MNELLVALFGLIGIGLVLAWRCPPGAARPWALVMRAIVRAIAVVVVVALL